MKHRLPPQLLSGPSRGAAALAREPGRTPQHDDDAIAAFISASGVTRCPTACAAPTQAVLAAADRLALRRLAERRELSWEAKQAARAYGPSRDLRLAEINRPFAGVDA